MVLCRIICTYGLVTLLGASFVECVKIHEYMTADDIVTVFNTNPDNIPEYDIVTVRHNLYKRSNSHLRLEFNAFGKKIDAYLQSSDGVLAGQNTPVWLASTQPNGTVEYTKMPGDIMGTAVRTYNSILHQSTMTAFMPEGEKVSFTGFIDAMKVIPLPKNVQKVVRSRREHESSKPSRTLLDTHYHVIIKSTPTTNENDMLMQLEKKIYETQVLNETNYSKLKRSTKDIIYPSILVSTDIAPSNTSDYEFAHYDEIIYQLAFWNAVDLRFRHVDNPKIRLRIAGIIIGLDRGATPYLNTYRKENEIILYEPLRDSSYYWFAMRKHPDFPLKAFDILATITDNHMMAMKKGEEWRILGTASVGSLCSRSNIRFYANTIINDEGSFGGVLVATHELGHIFGLHHDTKTRDECDESHLYIMHPSSSRGPNSLEWSPCSLRSLSYFLRKDKIDCVDEPAEFHSPGTPVQRLLPGDMVNTRKQCQDRGYDWACATSSTICTNLDCYHTDQAEFDEPWRCRQTGPALEGTTCSPGYKCLDGMCQYVSEESASESE